MMHVMVLSIVPSLSRNVKGGGVTEGVNRT
jgi:hypothetical protein